MTQRQPCHIQRNGPATRRHYKWISAFALDFQETRSNVKFLIQRTISWSIFCIHCCISCSNSHCHSSWSLSLLTRFPNLNHKFRPKIDQPLPFFVPLLSSFGSLCSDFHNLNNKAWRGENAKGRNTISFPGSRRKGDWLSICWELLTL